MTIQLFFLLLLWCAQIVCEGHNASISATPAVTLTLTLPVILLINIIRGL